MWSSSFFRMYLQPPNRQALAGTGAIFLDSAGVLEHVMNMKTTFFLDFTYF